MKISKDQNKLWEYIATSYDSSHSEWKKNMELYIENYGEYRQFGVLISNLGNMVYQ